MLLYYYYDRFLVESKSLDRTGPSAVAPYIRHLRRTTQTLATGRTIFIYFVRLYIIICHVSTKPWYTAVQLKYPYKVLSVYTIHIFEFRLRDVKLECRFINQTES